MKRPNAKLAIIGCGPKAVAIAVKAHVLNKLGLSEFKIDIFEAKAVGANWTGKSGYTDGEQSLCTAAERDLGFPYTSSLEVALTKKQRATKADRSLGVQLKAPENISFDGEPEITKETGKLDRELYKEYSWHAYLVEKKRKYRDWVDAGRHPPTHSEFSKYLYWALGKTSFKSKMARVEKLEFQANEWEIFASGEEETELSSLGNGYDGVIVTGPGRPASRIQHDVEVQGRLFNGEDFWLRTKEIRRLLRKSPDSSIAVIGGGGTGAAIIGWLVRNGYKDRQIYLIGNQATIYMRSETIFENRLFGNDDLWSSLTRNNQKIFNDRLNRGVVWASVLHEIEKAALLTPIDGKAKKISASERDELEVGVRGVKYTRVRASVVIDTSGFDAWWFTKLLPRVAGASRWSADDKETLRDSLNEGLFLDHKSLWKLPKLHVPGIADKHGPGLGNLMSLGAMSDRILGSYR